MNIITRIGIGIAAGAIAGSLFGQGILGIGVAIVICLILNNLAQKPL